MVNQNLHLMIDESMRTRLLDNRSLYAWWYLDLLGIFEFLMFWDQVWISSELMISIISCVDVYQFEFRSSCDKSYNAIRLDLVIGLVHVCS